MSFGFLESWSEFEFYLFDLGSLNFFICTVEVIYPPHRVIRRTPWDKRALSAMLGTHHTLQEGLFIYSFIHGHLFVVLVPSIGLLHRAPSQRLLVSPASLALSEEAVSGESVTCASWHLCQVAHLYILCSFVTINVWKDSRKLPTSQSLCWCSFSSQINDFQDIQLEK